MWAGERVSVCIRFPVYLHSSSYYSRCSWRLLRISRISRASHTTPVRGCSMPSGSCCLSAVTNSRGIDALCLLDFVFCKEKYQKRIFATHSVALHGTNVSKLLNNLLSAAHIYAATKFL